MEFKILHTNDVHSRFENFAKIVTKINEIKDNNTLILDAGDFNDFMRLELQGTDGLAGTELLELAGYDAITVGNNETFQGLDTLTNMAQNSKVPYLSCNLCKMNGERIEGLTSSIIVEKSGFKFLVIGTSPLLTQFYPLFGIALLDYKEAILKEIDKYKDRYDLCILLSHLGLIEDKDIANTMEGIDIIIDGHSHILMEEPMKINNTIIHMSGCYGEHLGVLEFNYDNTIVNYTGENIKIENVVPDNKIIESLKNNKEKAIECLGKPIYSINVDMWHDVVEENPITNLLADGVRDVLKCEIGLINSGILNGGIKQGDVSIKKLLEICPSPLNPTVMEIQGKHIRQALEASLQADICMQDGKGAGFRGKYLGRLHISGGRIEYNNRKIKRIIIGDKPLEEEKYYTVATSDYLQRGTGYDSLKNNQNEKYNREYLRDTLKDYLNKPDYIKNSSINRWIEAK